MRIMKLATGLAVGYVLGARAGREKYEQIVAVAQQARGRSGPDRTPGAVDEAATPVVVPPAEQPAPVTAGDQPRPPRKRRTKTAATSATPTSTTAPGATTATPVSTSATPSAVAGTPATGTADLGLDGPSLGAEADIVEQKTLVVDTRNEPARSSESLDGDTADVLEQRRSV